jgi:hypothetical protein
MRHVRSLRFEALETRQLLSGGRLDPAHISPAITGPLGLDGLLTVVHRPHAVTTTTHLDGSTTTSIPVSGQLGSLGQVRGVWSESVDAYGNYDGPDTLVLRNGKGSVLVAFDNLNTPRTAIRAPGGVNYEHPQRSLPAPEPMPVHQRLERSW